MACRTMGNMIVCCPNIYKYRHNGKDFYFEWHSYLGPTVVTKRDYEPRITIPSGFWDMVTEFQVLSELDRKQYLIAD